MLLPSLLALTLALTAEAAIFPSDSVVKMIDAKGFKKAMKQNQTSMVAFVAPWCGHCQRMAPEYSKAALGLYPLLPAYAVDCDADKNKRLCSEQGVKGFPTIKLFQRGGQLQPMVYDGERTASAFFYWASRRIPHGVKKLRDSEIDQWIKEKTEVPRILLLTKDKKMPLLWQTLGNKYGSQLSLGYHRDRKGKTSVKMGMEAGERDKPKVLVYPAGSTDYVRYEGINKFDSLSTFFDSILDGSADLTTANKAAAQEEFVPDPKEREIEQKQEAQRLALAHGGFTELIDFEKAIKEGAGADFHDANGYPGMMGGPPMPKLTTEGKVDTAGMLKKQKEAESAGSAEARKDQKTGDGAQAVFEAGGTTQHEKTPVAEATASVTPNETPVETESTPSAKDATPAAASTEVPPSEAAAPTETIASSQSPTATAEGERPTDEL